MVRVCLEGECLSFFGHCLLRVLPLSRNNEYSEQFLRRCPESLRSWWTNEVCISIFILQEVFELSLHSSCRGILWRQRDSLENCSKIVGIFSSWLCDRNTTERVLVRPLFWPGGTGFLRKERRSTWRLRKLRT
jgi:hypothetical protein